MTLRREAGEPPSGNGASSLHLFWDLPGRFESVGASLTVVEPPAVDRLYFWAMQVSFGDQGAAHVGLQWPDMANFGGYRSDGTGELDGPGTNTWKWSWAVGVTYRLQVEPGPSRDEWVGTIAGGGRSTTRTLRCPGPHLHSAMVWSEVFARCEHPSTVVRWSDLWGRTVDGEVRQVESVRTNYQRYEDGGCTNTDNRVAVDGAGWEQVTATDRITRSGATLRLRRD